LGRKPLVGLVIVVALAAGAGIGAGVRPRTVTVTETETETVSAPECLDALDVGDEMLDQAENGSDAYTLLILTGEQYALTDLRDSFDEVSNLRPDYEGLAADCRASG
jgi:hypothetical protein